WQSMSSMANDSRAERPSPLTDWSMNRQAGWRSRLSNCSIMMSPIYLVCPPGFILKGGIGLISIVKFTQVEAKRKTEAFSQNSDRGTCARTRPVFCDRLKPYDPKGVFPHERSCNHTGRLVCSP